MREASGARSRVVCVVEAAKPIPAGGCAHCTARVGESAADGTTAKKKKKKIV